jgi:ABC-type branched-subunit amino acid transport system permease subunit
MPAILRDRRVTLPVGAVLLVVAPLLLHGQEYLLRLCNEVLLNAVIILGFLIILGFTKQFSLGQVAFYGIGAYTVALLTASAGWNFFLALPVAGLLAGALAVLVGIPCVRFEGPWFALVTFAFAEIVRILMIRWKEVTGGAQGFYNIPRPTLGGLQLTGEFHYIYLFLVLAGAAVALAVHLQRSPFGRLWLAIGDTPHMVAAMGTNVALHRILAFFVGSVLAGLAGGLFAGYTTFISPDSFTINHTIYFLTILVVGGLESIPGAILSVAMFTLLSNYLLAFYPWDLLLQGLTIVLFMNFLPRGLGSLATRLLGAAENRPGAAAREG